MKQPVSSIASDQRVQRSSVTVVALLCFTNLLSYMDRTALSILLPPIRAELELSDTELGLLTGLAFALFYAFAGIPIARLADKYSRSRIIALSVAAWSLVTAATGAASSFVQLFLARIGVAIGEAGAIPPAHSLVSDIFPPERRAAILALHSAAGPVGTLLGLVLGGWLAVVVGWRWTFVLLGLPGLLVALAVYLHIQEPARGRFDGTAAVPDIGFSRTLVTLLSKPSYAYILGGFAIGVFVVAGLAQWLPSYFVREFDLSIRTVGTYYGFAFGGGSFLGMVGGAKVADYLIRRDMRWSLWMAAISYLCVFPLYLIVLLISNFAVAIGLVFIASMVAGAAYGPVWAAIQNVAPNNMRAMAAAIALLAGNLVGGGLGPLAVGMISDAAMVDSATGSLRYALLHVICLTPLPALLFSLGSRYLVKDLAEVTGQRTVV